MDITEQYDSIYQKAVSLQFRFRDAAPNRDQSDARNLENKIQKLLDDIKAQTNPRTLENVIQDIQRSLKNIDQNDQPIMDINKAEGLHDDYERLRMDLREMDNY